MSDQQYQEYLSYTKSLIFSRDKGDAEDILHKALERSAKHDYNPYYIYSIIRGEVLNNARRKRKRERVEMPQRTSKPEAYINLGIEDLLEVLRGVVVYTNSNQTKINWDKTNKAHKAILMTAKGYSNKEIAEEVNLTVSAVDGLKRDLKKKIKPLLKSLDYA